MHRLCRIVALCTAISFLLCSCATKVSRRQATSWSSPQACIAGHIAGGAAVGAVAGAVLAAATGKHVGPSAVAGTVTGGTLAFAYAWGKCFAAFTKVSSVDSGDYRSTKERTGYRPSQGTRVRIVKAAIEPPAITPGDQPEMRATYYIMLPSAMDVTVKETVGLKIYNPAKNLFEDLGESSETIVVAPGERRANSRIPIPSNAEEGKFFIVFKVEVQGQRDEWEMPLTITRDAVILAKARTAPGSPDANGSAPGSPDAKEYRSIGATTARPGSKGIRPGSSNVIVTVRKANLRDDPYEGSKVVAKAVQGQRFPLAKSVTVDGMKWHHIRLKNGKSAWIAGLSCTLTE